MLHYVQYNIRRVVYKSEDHIFTPVIKHLILLKLRFKKSIFLLMAAEIKR